MTRNPVCPFAIFRPSPNWGFFYESGQPIPFTPKAIVPHSADSSLLALPPQSFFAYGGQSTHFWIHGDGPLYQMVKCDVPAWGNGQLTAPSGPTSSNALVKEWFRTNRNPNLDTYSVEFAGFGQSRGDQFSKPTSKQIETWRRLCEWLLAEKWLDHIGADNCITHGMISNTACPDGRFTAGEMAVLAGGDDMFTKNHEEMLYGLIDLLIGRADGVEYTNDIERLIVLRDAIKNDMRYNLGLSLTQAKVAELAKQLSELTSGRAPSTPSAEKFAKIAEALEKLSGAYRDLANDAHSADD